MVSNYNSKESLNPNEQNYELAQLIEAKVSELETTLRKMPSRDDITEILDKLEKMRPLETWEWLGRISDLAAVFDAAIRVVRLIG